MASLEDKIEILKNLLKEFEALPKVKQRRTYLDICDYSGRRFEEICSRILAFYFEPKNEHGFNTLFAEALLDAIKHEYIFIDNDIKVDTEVYADGKFLDIVLCNNDWVICIENKIDAGLYNELGEYKKYIEKNYAQPTKIFIVLYLKEIKSEGKEKIKQHQFKQLSYMELFSSIKSKVGFYYSGDNNKHLVFLNDFMQTLENLQIKGENIMSKELDEFFQKNTQDLDELFKVYQDFKKAKQNEYKKKLDDLIIKLNKKIDNGIDNGIWKQYNSGDFVYSRISMSKKDNNDIGVEAWYEEKDNDLFAYFRIAFIIWGKGKKNDLWAHYEKPLRNKYPNTEFESRGRDNHMFLHLKEKLNGQEEKEIIEKLNECRDFIMGLAPI